MTTSRNQTNEKTFNNKVKAQTVQLIPTAKKNLKNYTLRELVMFFI